MSVKAPLQPRVRFQAVSQPGVTGRPMRRRTIGPASSGLGEGLASRDVLVSSCSSDSLWRAGRLQADIGRQFNSVSSDTMEVFPVHYGPLYDTALQTLVWEFLSRLEELLPVPDLTQTTAWLGAAPSVLEECGQTVFDPEQLKTVLQHHQHHGNLNNSHDSNYTTDTILSTLSLPPIIRVVINYEPDNSDNVRPFSDDDEDHNEILDEDTDRCLEDLGLSTSQEQEGLSPAETSVLVTPVPCDGRWMILAKDAFSLKGM
ncbi:uncharacterized protein LOC135515406 [Oncorhynchus masou masou]|uniref:uncharacterized protein LOC135515406 n=1 Tax=Oncorhynchus masou masou TaxID=90313 RepID=UPI0031838618